VVRSLAAKIVLTTGLLTAAVLGLSSCSGESGTRKAAESLPIRDDFEGECTWPQETTDNDEVGCSDGQYSVVIKRSGNTSFIPRRTQDGHRSVSVAARTSVVGTLGKNDFALQGVGCWASGRGDPVLGYVFALTALGDGSRGYLIARHNEDDPELEQNPLRMEALVDEESDSLPALGEAADLRGECRKEGDVIHLGLYVDGTKVAEATDSQDAPAIDAFVAYGFVAAASQSGIDIRYDDFIAEEPSPGSGTSSETSTPTQAAPEALPSHVVYRETFARQTADWPKDSHSRVVSGALHMRGQNERSALSLSQSLGEQLSRVVIDVKVGQPKSRTGQEQGLSCLKDYELGYSFSVQPDARVWRISRVTTSEVTEIAGRPDKRDVRAAPAVNRLRAVCEIGADSQARLTLFVNGRMVGQKTDTTDVPSFDSLSLDLQPGLLGGEAVFDDLVARGS
jgi:hypothetical protein